MKYICLASIEDEYFRWADGIAVIGAARAQNSAEVGLDDRSREHRSLDIVISTCCSNPQSAIERRPYEHEQ